MLSLLFWIFFTSLLALSLLSYGYTFAEAFYLSLLFVPGIVVSRFAVSHIDSSTVSINSNADWIDDDDEQIIQTVWHRAIWVLLLILVIECFLILTGHFILMQFSKVYLSIKIPLLNPILIVLVTFSGYAGSFFFDAFSKCLFEEKSQSISFVSNRKKVVVDTLEILYIESRDTEVWVHASGQRKWRNKTRISQWETSLGDSFCRIHRSFLVNIKYISSISEVGDSLSLVDGTELPISLKYRNRVAVLMNCDE